jgi:pimeloyl-ACP methyl ester carboxylesterase
MLCVAALLSACSPESKWDDYYRDEVVPYYLYLPGSASAPAPVLVVLPGEAASAAECFDLWQPIAEDRELALICPELPDEALSVPSAMDLRLGDVLTSAYGEASLASRFFLAGFGDSGVFALEYAFRYPQFVSGVSVMSVEAFPEPNSSAAHAPFQFAVGESDRDRKTTAEAAAESWRQAGLLVRVVSVAGNGERPNQDFARLVGDLAVQTARQTLP